MALPATDSFTSGIEQPLTTYSANWTLNTNAGFSVDDIYTVYPNGGSNYDYFAHWNADSFNDNQYAQLVIVSLAADKYLGPAVRIGASGCAGYEYTGSSADSCLVSVDSAFTVVQLGDSGAAFVVAHTYRIEASGTNITPKKDGVVADIGTQSDSTNTSGYAGITGGSGGDSNMAGDNWEGGDLEASSSSSSSSSTSSSTTSSSTTSSSTTSSTTSSSTTSSTSSSSSESYSTSTSSTTSSSTSCTSTSSSSSESYSTSSSTSTSTSSSSSISCSSSSSTSSSSSSSESYSTSTSSTTSSSTSCTSTSSSTSSSSSSSYSLPPLDPCEGELAFGEQNPLAGEIPISWRTFDDGAGGAVTVTGDVDWGKLTITTGEEGRSFVYDLGAIPVGSMRILTLTENRYGTGSGTATLQIRGDTSSFNQDDNEPPNWQNYTTAFVTDWRYVQTRELKSV